MSLDFKYPSRLSVSSDCVFNIRIKESWAGHQLCAALSKLPAIKFASSTDMRFQIKQKQEQEQKRQELKEASRLRDSADIKIPSTPLTPGKVRQMFDERRQRIGIDKSKPLKPIVDRSSPVRHIHMKSLNLTETGRRLNPTDNSQLGYEDSPRFTRKPIGGRSFLSNKHQSEKNFQNEEFPRNLLDNELLGTAVSLTKRQFSDIKIDSSEGDKNNNKEKITVARVTADPTVKIGNLTKAGAPTKVKSHEENETQIQISNKSTPTRKLSKIKKTTIGSKSTKSPKDLEGVKTVMDTIQVNPDGTPTSPTVKCQVCGRNFLSERLAKHQQICEKTKKKRKVFDAAKHRVQGTEAENYLKKPAKSRKSLEPSRSVVVKKVDWRKKHEEFIQAIRAAKEMKAYLAKGGKLSDLPPPPPSENPDYIQCPHCNRRFNEAAASRHIPKCATMLHNKPNPNLVRKK